MTHAIENGQAVSPGTESPEAASPGSASPGTGPRFGGQSCWTDIGGPVHYLDYGGPAGAPVIVAVHGLEGCAVNWSALAPLLTGRYRVLAPDLAGHGFTRSAGRGVDVTSNRVLLHRFIEEVAGSPVILMGNSMGGMISLSEAAAAPDTVTGLILLDPAVPFGPVRPDPSIIMMFLVNMIPGLGERMISRRRQFSPEQLVAGVLETVCADPSRVPPAVVGQHIEVARRRFGYTEADREFTLAARSVVSAAGYVTGRAYRRAVELGPVPGPDAARHPGPADPGGHGPPGGPRPPGVVTGCAAGRGTRAAAGSAGRVCGRDPRMARPGRPWGRRRCGHRRRHVPALATPTPAP